MSTGFFILALVGVFGGLLLLMASATGLVSEKRHSNSIDQRLDGYFDAGNDSQPSPRTAATWCALPWIWPARLRTAGIWIRRWRPRSRPRAYGSPRPSGCC